MHRRIPSVLFRRLGETYFLDRRGKRKAVANR